LPELLKDYKFIKPYPKEGWEYETWEEWLEDIKLDECKNKDSEEDDDCETCLFEEALDKLYKECQSTVYPLPSCRPKIKKVEKPKWAFNCSCERYWYYIWVP
jgi:hypothetical protein